MAYSVRAATPQDCGEISRMIMELAVYEKLEDQVKISSAELERDGFSTNPYFHCLIAEVPEEFSSKEGHRQVGYALYYNMYSTFEGRCIYLEDLYVMPEFRGRGIGKALIRKVAQVVKEQRCARLQLSVLDWNTPSLQFYLSRGARDLTACEGWHSIRFEGKALDELAQVAPES